MYKRQDVERAEGRRVDREVNARIRHLRHVLDAIAVVEGVSIGEDTAGSLTPTSASWINQVERWFAELTRKQLERGAHRSTAELEKDIASFIEAHNENPKPYTWVKSADEILASVKRFCQRVDRTLCTKL